MNSSNYSNIGETVFSDVLPNGLRLNVVPKKGFNTGFAALAVDYGGAHRNFYLDGELIKTPAGIAHYLEHKMFDLPNGDNALNLLSANGADPNAATSSDNTIYYFQCTKNFEDNLRLLLHFVSTPYFTEETVQKEQGIIGQEIRMGEDSPGYAVYYNLLKLLYRAHPIRDSVAGTVESIAQITEKTLYDCHRVFYAPGNLVLCVEGDVDPERIRAIALEELPAESGSLPKADFGEDEGVLPEGTLKSVEMSVSAPQFLIGAKIKAAPAGKEALRQRLVSQLSMRVLAGSSSPFYTRLYEQGLLNRDFDADVDFAAGTGTVMIGGESNEPEKIFEALKAEVASIAEKGLDAEFFERSKRASLGARLRGLEDFSTVCLSLAECTLSGYCSFDAFSVLADINKSECESFITQSLAPERLAMSVVSPKKD